MFSYRKLKAFFGCVCLFVALMVTGGSIAAMAAEPGPPFYLGTWQYVTYLPGGYSSNHVDVSLQLRADGGATYAVHNPDGGPDFTYTGEWTYEVGNASNGAGLRLELDRDSFTSDAADIPPQVDCLLSVFVRNPSWLAAITVEEGDALPYGLAPGQTVSMTLMD